NESAATSDEVRVLLKGELKTLDAQIKTALRGVTDIATKRHLDDSHEQIVQILDPRAMRASAAGGAGARGRGGFVAGRTANISGTQVIDSAKKYDFNNDPFLQSPTGCWPDRMIK